MRTGKWAGLGLLAAGLPLLLAAVMPVNDAWADPTERRWTAFEVTRLESRAKQGDADAEYKLARAYDTGEGLPKDPALAMIHLSRAAALGNVQAQYELARYYEDNRDLAGADQEARKWYARAAAAGHPDARVKVGDPEPPRRQAGTFNPPAAPGVINLDDPRRTVGRDQGQDQGKEQYTEAEIREILGRDAIPEGQITLADPEDGNYAVLDGQPSGKSTDEHAPEQRFAETAPDTDGKPAEADPVKLASLPTGAPSCQELFNRMQDGIKAVDAARVEDPDVSRNRALIKRAGLCLGVNSFKDGGRDWTLQYLFNPAKQPGPVWAVPHDDEDSAFDAAVRLVDSHGGGAIMVEAGEQREHMGQDPNRIFATSRREARRCRSIDKPQEHVVEAFMAAFGMARPERLFLSLHSNDDGYKLGGGQGTISVNRTTLKMAPYPTAIVNRALPPEVLDEDSLILMAVKSRRKMDKATRATIDSLNGEGLNVVVEQVSRSGNDCSLSNHVVLNNLGDYYNIEVEHGRTEVQVRMAELLLKILGIKSQPSPIADNYFIPGGG